MKAKGFTLIEVLVALGIFAVISVMGYRGLSALIDSERHLASEAARWQQLDRFFTELESDFRYAAPRGGRDPGGLLHRPFEAVPAPLGPDDGHLTLTRFGDGDDLAGTPGMRRIAYRFEEKSVVLLVWPALDAAPLARPDRVDVLGGVTGASLRYLDPDGRWNLNWPPANRINELPSAVELTLTIDGIGPVTRLFAR